MGSMWGRIRERPTTFTALLMLGIGLTASIIGFETIGALVLTVGLVVIVPLVYLFVRPELEPAAEEPETHDPFEQLQFRYARGEISEAEFESKVDRLLETESLNQQSVRSEILQEKE